jgi:NAD(P)-dependent dehydrogenase (short-subunit alcohol dehydrogenase family)
VARIFITGSSDGLGLMAAQLLVGQGHDVVLHARNSQRADETQNKLPTAESVVVGDLTSITQMRHVADQVNKLGRFDAVIHNAGIGYSEPKRIVTEDGLPHVLAVNTIAPYILTALITRPKRLVYVSSILHQHGDSSLKDLMWADRPWSGRQAYCDTKFHDALLAFAVARRWPSVFSNALEPGWVPTKLGGSSATDDLDQGYRTQVWLAVSDDPAAKASGEYFYHMEKRDPLPATRDAGIQDRLLDFCSHVTGVELPSNHYCFAG